MAKKHYQFYTLWSWGNLSHRKCKTCGKELGDKTDLSSSHCNGMVCLAGMIKVGKKKV